MEILQRRLPHHYVVGDPLFVTFRLYGSLPVNRGFSTDTMSSGQAFVCMDRLLERQRSGPMFLGMPAVAQLVADAILAGEGTDYELHAWVILPNHVHLLITPLSDVSELMRKLKGRSARTANQFLGRSGPFWQDESYDRRVRDSEEFRRIQRYILNNPVRAGLCRSVDEYPWAGLKSRAG